MRCRQAAMIGESPGIGAKGSWPLARLFSSSLTGVQQPVEKEDLK